MLSTVESGCFWRVETGISGLRISVGLITDTDSVWGRLSIAESDCFWRFETGISGLTISVGLIVDTDSV
ncbi:hypothetical protein PA905_49700 [Planktothrix agardhii CCAP 1459/11A]|uniref:Uncharacterized protein n=1 Tax=Planktothrix agardhii CCAP 1459/11A TaxID=282420 RepID=A0A4P5ZJU1_PLAAG|nr:hypothetical protein PA905_49700 [Planktothrix agardhii CCAP 1459/11A]